MIGKNRLDVVVGSIRKSAKLITNFNASLLFGFRSLPGFRFIPKDVPLPFHWLEDQTISHQRKKTLFKRHFRQIVVFSTRFSFLLESFESDEINKKDYYLKIKEYWPPLYEKSIWLKVLMGDWIIPISTKQIDIIETIAGVLREKSSFTEYISSTYPAIIRAIYYSLIFCTSLYLVKSSSSVLSLSNVWKVGGVFLFLILVIFLVIVIGIRIVKIYWNAIVNIWELLEEFLLPVKYILEKEINDIIEFIESHTFTDRKVKQYLIVSLEVFSSLIFKAYLNRSNIQTKNFWEKYRFVFILWTNLFVCVLLTIKINELSLFFSYYIFFWGFIGVWVTFISAIVYTVIAILIPIGFIANVTLNMIENSETLPNKLLFLGIFSFLLAKLLAMII